MIYLMRRMDVARCCFALQVPFNEVYVALIIIILITLRDYFEINSQAMDRVLVSLN